MSNQQSYYSQLELYRFTRRTVCQQQLHPIPAYSVTAWQELSQQVAHCQACPLHQHRTQTVFGSGNQQAKLMIIGEAPGFYEDQQGLPFVGRAGQLLTAMLQAIQLNREEVI